MTDNNKVSLLIPVKDEASNIDILIDSILNQALRPDEIIIVDGGSTDGTISKIEGYINQGVSINFIKTKNSYPGKGRNIAVQNSNYELIAFTDAGIQLSPSWLSNLIKVMQGDETIDIVYGNYEPIVNSFFKKCAALSFVKPKEKIGNALIRHHFIASSLMKKDVWRAVEGFPDLRAAEDRIFMENVDKKGFKVAFAPNATVYWQIPSNKKLLFKRFYEFSYYDLIAKRAKDWHYAVFKMYSIGALVLICGIIFEYLYLAISILILGNLLRAFKRLRQNQQEIGVFFEEKTITGFARKTKLLLYVSAIIVILDIAMFVGTFRWLLDKLHSNKPTKAKKC